MGKEEDVRVTLRQLRYFRALVEHGSFSRAAESVFVSQPALSLQIQELEGTLGDEARHVDQAGFNSVFRHCPACHFDVPAIDSGARHQESPDPLGADRAGCGRRQW